MSKIYFSRSITRTLSADHPVGDPTGGAAYGEKNDPVSAIVSLVTMGGTYAAAGSSFAAMTVMQGITFAGAALNLVGNVSGNKTLQKIGMVAGIAGGIGQLAGIQGPTLGETFGKLGSSPVTAPVTGPSTVGNLSQTTTPVSGTAQSYAANQLGTTTVAPVATTSNAASVANAVDAAEDIATAAARAKMPYGGMGSGGASDLANISPPSAGGGLWESVKGAGKSLMDFTKDNPGGAVMLGSTASTVSDYLTGKTDAEIAALEAQTGYADANALRMQEEIAKEKRRRENLNAGYAQVNTGINVNPAVLGQAQAGGLISGAMQPAA
jgi:hypothetical protein